jgi:hypothetical protein
MTQGPCNYGSCPPQRVPSHANAWVHPPLNASTFAPALCPGLSPQLVRAPAPLVAQLAANTTQIAQRLVALKLLFPEVCVVCVSAWGQAGACRRWQLGAGGVRVVRGGV